MAQHLRTIHPFPARMAPDILSEWIQNLPSESTVLDPMCGSGFVVRQSLMAGHKSIGLDIDPLAVLMSRVWTKRVVLKDIDRQAAEVCDQARSLRSKSVVLPWMDDCQETTQFTEYWFAPAQRDSLRRLAYVLTRKPETRSDRLNDIFWLALSRIIITKHVGASLAWDVSHSRPHKVRQTNDFDVHRGFLRAVKTISKTLAVEKLPRCGRIYKGDGRHLKQIKSRSIDAIFSSPPYLNAIDYIRGHKFSLIWMGYTIPELRDLRAGSVGAERSPDDNSMPDLWTTVVRQVPNLHALALRQQRIVARYVGDSTKLLTEFKRVLKPGATLALVLGNSSIRGQYIANSKIYDVLATQLRFRKLDERQRTLEVRKRYLPVVSRNNTLENRIRHEIIQVYEALA